MRKRKKDGTMERGGGQRDNNEPSAKLRSLRHIIPPSRTPLSLQKGKNCSQSVENRARNLVVFIEMHCI